MKYIMFILLAFGIVFANSYEDALEAYYSASVLEDANAFMESVDTSNASSSQLANTLELTILIWEEYDTDAYSISNLECIEDAGYALCKYSLYAKISGAETLSYDLEYISLLHKIDGLWKVSFAMPLDEYLETRAEQQKLATTDAMLDDLHELYLKEPIDGSKYLTFNGAPLQDLSTDLNEMHYSCTTDEYCQQNGYGASCEGGTCSGAPEEEWEEIGWENLATSEPSGEEEPCALAFLILILFPVLLIKGTQSKHASPK